ncbi:hypothetical protein [Eisenbergiella porci]|uniref:hypothetical protein n=1 Tax=Eisenbergiella porci TaxID=2652274 RepID=UPI002A805BC0|nr:hypothetical protein [Eisenbergiella porci]
MRGRGQCFVCGLSVSVHTTGLPAATMPEKNALGHLCMEADVMRKGFAEMQGLFLIEIFVWTAECDGRKTPVNALEISVAGTKREE